MFNARVTLIDIVIVLWPSCGVDAHVVPDPEARGGLAETGCPVRRACLTIGGGPTDGVGLGTGTPAPRRAVARWRRTTEQGIGRRRPPGIRNVATNAVPAVVVQHL